MTLRGWVPAAGPLSELQREMNRLFDSVFGKHVQQLGRIRAGYVYPPMTVRETRDDYVVECEVPGLEMDDLEVTVTGNHLTVAGRRADAVPEENVTLHRRERDAGRFSRALTLPGTVDSTKCEAHLAKGILSIRVPKAEETKPKRVPLAVEGRSESAPKKIDTKKEEE